MNDKNKSEIANWISLGNSESSDLTKPPQCFFLILKDMSPTGQSEKENCKKKTYLTTTEKKE